MTVQWVKCEGDVFCPLENVNLSSIDYQGVYLIWHNTTARVIYVGQGRIRDRLEEHRSSPEINARKANGVLLVSWVRFDDQDDRLSVERYLHRVYSPLLSSCGTGPEIEVNPPA